MYEKRYAGLVLLDARGQYVGRTNLHAEDHLVFDKHRVELSVFRNDVRLGWITPEHPDHIQAMVKVKIEPHNDYGLFARVLADRHGLNAGMDKLHGCRSSSAVFILSKPSVK